MASYEDADLSRHNTLSTENCFLSPGFNVLQKFSPYAEKTRDCMRKKSSH